MALTITQDDLWCRVARALAIVPKGYNWVAMKTSCPTLLPLIDGDHSIQIAIFEVELLELIAFEIAGVRFNM